MEQITNYPLKHSLAIDCVMISDRGIVIDDDDANIILAAENFMEPNITEQHIQVQEELEIGTTIERIKDIYRYNFYNIHLVFIFLVESQEYQTEELKFGWYAHKLFDEEGQINQGRFTVNIWKPPIQKKIPFTEQIQNMNILFDFSLYLSEVNYQDQDDIFLNNNQIN